eukprot:9455023-Pyramimonas_sp.AAC.1
MAYHTVHGLALLTCLGMDIPGLYWTRRENAAGNFVSSKVSLVPLLLLIILHIPTSLPSCPSFPILPFPILPPIISSCLLLPLAAAWHIRLKEDLSHPLQKTTKTCPERATVSTSTQGAGDPRRMHSRPALLDAGDDRAGGSQGTWNSTQSADSNCTRPRARTARR